MFNLLNTAPTCLDQPLGRQFCFRVQNVPYTEHRSSSVSCTSFLFISAESFPLTEQLRCGFLCPMPLQTLSQQIPVIKKGQKVDSFSQPTAELRSYDIHYASQKHPDFS